MLEDRIVAARAKNPDEITLDLDLDFSAFGEEADDDAVELAEMLKDAENPLESLSLIGNGLGERGFQALAEALVVNQRLQVLDLSLNGDGGKEIILLAEGLKHNQGLKKLMLIETALNNESVTALAEALNHNQTLEVLDIGSHDETLTEAGFVTLFQSLEKNQTLQSLALAFNDLGDEGAEALCALIQSNHTLKAVDLKGCEMGANGLRRFITSLESNESLECIDLSVDGLHVHFNLLIHALKQNHTLKKIIMKLEERQLEHSEALELIELLKVNDSLQEIEFRPNGIEDSVQHEIQGYLICNQLNHYWQHDRLNGHGIDGALKRLDEILSLDTFSTHAYFSEYRRFFQALLHASEGEVDQWLPMLLEQPFETASLRRMSDELLSESLLPIFAPEVLERAQIEGAERLNLYQAFSQLLAYTGRHEQNVLFVAGLFGSLYPDRMLTVSDSEAVLKDLAHGAVLIDYETVLSVISEAMDRLGGESTPEMQLLTEVKSQKSYHPVDIEFLSRSESFLEQLKARYPGKYAFRLIEELINPSIEAQTIEWPIDVEYRVQAVTETTIAEYHAQKQSSSVPDFERFLAEVKGKIIDYIVPFEQQRLESSVQAVAPNSLRAQPRFFRKPQGESSGSPAVEAQTSSPKSSQK